MNHNEYKALCKKAREIIEFYESHVESEDDIYFGGDRNCIYEEYLKESVSFNALELSYWCGKTKTTVTEKRLFVSKRPLNPQHRVAVNVAHDILRESDIFNFRSKFVDFMHSVELPQEGFIKITPALIQKKKAEWLLNNKDFLEKNKKEVEEFKAKQEKEKSELKLKEDKEKQEQDNIEKLEKDDRLINTGVFFFLIGVLSGIFISTFF